MGDMLCDILYISIANTFRLFWWMVVDLPFIKSSLKLETIYTMIKLAAAEHQEQGVIAELRFKNVFDMTILFSWK